MPFLPTTWNKRNGSVATGSKNIVKNILIVFGLATVYYGASKFGFMLAFTAKQVSAVWPPTGIALAAMLIFGPRVWPGIALGAFFANFTTSEPALTACGIAAGNTLEALVGAWLLRRVAGFNLSLGHLKDVRSLLLFSAIFGTVISATFGITSLCLSGIQPWKAYWPLWLLWWVGDATGAIIVAPLLLAWSRRARLPNARTFIEATLLFLGLAAISITVFSRASFHSMKLDDFFYLVFVFVIWAAIRFGQRGTTLVTFVTSGIAIWAALHNAGPFTDMPADQNFAALQIFVAVIAMTGLFLSAAVTERRQAEDALMASNRNKDDFLSMLAHELRNPLASISGALHLAQLPTVNAEQRAKAQAIMERQVQQTIRLIEDLVDVARISHGKIELRRASVTLAEAIAVATETVAPLMEDSRHTLSLKMPPEKLWLDADLTRLSQIFINLLNNAAKYTPAGGRIDLIAENKGQTVSVRVRDSGLGIAPDMLPKVFDMFMQASSLAPNSAPRSASGLGVGLTLVKRLAEMHGGTVGAYSQGPGKGSEFTVQLPLIAAPEIVSDNERTVSASAKPERKLKILVADDNESFAETFSYMLQLLGHDVLLAHDGHKALRLAATYLPDVVLLDIGLPGLNGYHVCQKLRTMPALKDCMIIAQTGYSQPEYRERSRAAGFDHHLIKPVKFDVIEELLVSLGAANSHSEEEPPLAKTA